MGNPSKVTVSASLIILLISLLSCGYLSLLFGKDLGWDLANYHLSNAFALLNNRLGFDYWPVSYPHAYFSPTADLIGYFLTKYFTSNSAIFISGAIHGINLWLLFQIATYFVSAKRWLILSAFLIAFLGMYGPIGFTNIGNFKIDHIVSIFVLTFVLLKIRTLHVLSNYNKFSLPLFVLSYFCLGIAVGLKLTAALFVLGAMLTFAFVFPLEKSKQVILILWSGFAILAGNLLSAGYWEFMLWKNFHNPFYPNLQFTLSMDEISPVLKDYAGIRPHGLLKNIFYPFYFSFEGTGDGPFRDFRFMVVYLLLIVSFISAMVFGKKSPKRIQELKTKWLILFFIFSYIVGQIAFASIRYMLALEMLAPLIIYLLIKNIFKDNKTQTALTFGLLYFIAYTMVSVDTYRVAKGEEDYFNVKIPTEVLSVTNAMVLMPFSARALNLNPQPQAYLTAFLPSQWRYIGLSFFNNKFYPTKTDLDNTEQLIHHHQGRFYLLTAFDSMAELYRAAKHFNLVPKGACFTINSDRSAASASGNGSTMLCPAVKG